MHFIWRIFINKMWHKASWRNWFIQIYRNGWYEASIEMSICLVQLNNPSVLKCRPSRCFVATKIFKVTLKVSAGCSVYGGDGENIDVGKAVTRGDGTCPIWISGRKIHADWDRQNSHPQKQTINVWLRTFFLFSKTKIQNIVFRLYGRDFNWIKKCLPYEW